MGLLATLDDLSLDAANASVQLLAADEREVLAGKSPDVGRQGAVLALTTAGSSCNDTESEVRTRLANIGLENERIDFLIQRARQNPR